MYIGYMIGNYGNTPIFVYGHGGYQTQIVEDPTQQDYKKALKKCEDAYYKVH